MHQKKSDGSSSSSSAIAAWSVSQSPALAASLASSHELLIMSSIMLQVVSGDSWASAISRGLFNELDSDGNAKTDPLVAFFFVSYFLVASIVLLNVVVAVLLDEFMASVAHEKDEMMAEQQAEAEKKRITGVLDPITQRISSFDDLEDLRAKIQQIYEQLDDDQSGGLTFLEFKKNLKRLPQTSAINMTQDDLTSSAITGDTSTPPKSSAPANFRP